MIKKNELVVAGLMLLILACSEKVKAPAEFTKSINEWHKNRVDRLVNNSPWLKLAGLFWLEEGNNTFGSNKENDIIFPAKAPSQIGSFTLNDGIVSVKINEEINVYYDSTLVRELNLNSDISGAVTELQLGSFRWYLIDREGRLGIRLIDDEHPALKEFEGIELFEPDSSWRIKAEYIAYDPPKIVITPNVLGTESTDSCYGRIQFEKDNITYSLDPSYSGDYHFIVFADKTNGDETYGAGRFLIVEKPDSLGNFYIDFNKAYNPPCAFSKYATCPLPPKDNYLKLAVKAGEKKYDSDYH